MDEVGGTDKEGQTARPTQSGLAVPDDRGGLQPLAHSETHPSLSSRAVGRRRSRFAGQQFPILSPSALVQNPSRAYPYTFFNNLLGVWLAVRSDTALPDPAGFRQPCRPSIRRTASVKPSSAAILPILGAAFTSSFGSISPWGWEHYIGSRGLGSTV
jgi:hypothetical protein